MFVSRRIARPYTGKMDLVMERTQRLAEIMSRHGANTRITRVVAGEGAGEIHVYAQYDTMAAGTAAAASAAVGISLVGCPPGSPSAGPGRFPAGVPAGCCPGAGFPGRLPAFSGAAAAGASSGTSSSKTSPGMLPRSYCSCRSRSLPVTISAQVP